MHREYLQLGLFSSNITITILIVFQLQFEQFRRDCFLAILVSSNTGQHISAPSKTVVKCNKFCMNWENIIQIRLQVFFLTKDETPHLSSILMLMIVHYNTYPLLSIATVLSELRFHETRPVANYPEI